MSEPAYDPMRYNKDKKIQEIHNCWAYGMNVVDPTQVTQCDGKGPDCVARYHQPGGTKGMSDVLLDAKGRTCTVVAKLMKADVPDIQRTTFKARCPTGTSKIAMVVHPGEDYHFYRLDSDGKWSHKDGSNEVKRHDAEGQPIVNPKTAARNYRPTGSYLNYKNFCGFWCVPRRRTIKLAR